MTRLVRSYLHWALLFAALLLFGLKGSTLHAQNLGSIVGLVTDKSGAVVPNAEVKITDQNTGLARTFTTNESGNYVASALPVGTYTVEVINKGFKTFKRTDVVLNLRDTIRVDVQLDLGEITETVEITAESVRLVTENATVSEIVTGTQVQAISMNARNFLSLASLVPGASSTQPAFNVPVGVSSNASISFNGTRVNHNVWRVDGQENYDRGCGGCVTVLPSIDAIAEFKVGTANTEVDTGFGTAGQINLSIKSGTRAFHGTVFEFLRNDKLDATNFFLNQAGSRKQHLRFNNPGYNIGGPVMLPGLYSKDNPKTFFFWSQEWRRLRQGVVFSVPTIPEAWRRGDFSSSNRIIIDPDTGQPFSGNIIPQNRIDSNAAILAAPDFLFPLPTSGNTFAGSTAVPIDVREEILRVDHNISDKHQVFFRFILDTISQQFATTQWGSQSYPTVGTLFTNTPKVFHLQMTSTISPKVVNEASISFARQPLNLQPTGNFARPSNLRIPELFPDNRANRIPNINLNGPALGVQIDYGAWPWDNVSNTFFYRDNVTWNRGAHTMTLGGVFMHFVKQQDLFGQTQGAFQFDGSATTRTGVANSGHEFADFLLGRAFQYQELSQQFGPTYITKSFGFWFNDSWQVNPQLTLNWGLRWDGHPHAYEERDRVSSFYIDRFDPARAPQVDSNGRIVPGTGDPLNGLGLAGQNGVPRGLVENHWNLFQPRLGFAWRPWGSDTVIRAGYGIFYERIQGNDIYNVAPNPPNATIATIRNTTLSNPGGGTQAIFPSQLTVYDPNYEIPQVQQYNFGIQHRLAPGVVMTTSYVGTKGTHLQSTRNLNQPTPQGAAQVLAGTAIVNQVRPYLGFDNINMYYNGTNSNYNSLQVSLRSDNYKGLTLQGSYTWSHAIDYVSGDVPGNSHQDNYNLRAERGNSEFDRRHMLVLNYVYDLPFLKNAQGALKTILGGWQLSGIASFQTGTPIDITLPGDNAGVGGSFYRPNLVGNPTTGTGDRVRFFDPAAFAAPTRGLFGNAGRRVVFGGGLNNWDISLFKNFRGLFGRESNNLQFRAEFYNAFNHTQFNSYRNSFGTADFGNANGARDARSIQFGLKFYF